MWSEISKVNPLCLTNYSILKLCKNLISAASIHRVLYRGLYGVFERNMCLLCFLRTSRVYVVCSWPKARKSHPRANPSRPFGSAQKHYICIVYRHRPRAQSWAVGQFITDSAKLKTLSRCPKTFANVFFLVKLPVSVFNQFKLILIYVKFIQREITWFSIGIEP